MNRQPKLLSFHRLAFTRVVHQSFALQFPKLVVVQRKFLVMSETQSNTQQKRGLEEVSDSGLESPPNKRRKLGNWSSKEETKRGAFIVFEGIDRCGKSTQCRELAEYFSKQGIKYEFLRYPNRNSQSGKLINDYLQNTASMNDRAIHLLFAANRHEDTEKIVKLLNDGVTIICDRYSYSGAAYSSAKLKKNEKEECKEKEKEKEKGNETENENKKNGENDCKSEELSIKCKDDFESLMDINWCLTCEQGLPKPDKIIYLNIDLNEAQKRGGFGNERYEKFDFLKRVQMSYQKMISKQDKNDKNLWSILNANRAKEEIHKDIIAIAHSAIDDASTKSIDFI